MQARRSTGLFPSYTDGHARHGGLGFNAASVLGPQQKITPHLACLLARLMRYILRHVSRYAPVDAPCRRIQIWRNLLELFLSVSLKGTPLDIIILRKFSERGQPSSK